jgi:hypothetical protein
VSEPLEELADALCRGFCGWQLQHDKRVLTRLGSGRLYVDLLTKTCRFGRDYIPALVIVDKLAQELRRHMDSGGAAVEKLRSATLKIELTVDEHEEQKDRSVMWFGEHDGFVGCQMEIESCIGTADGSHSAKHRGYVEWPLSRQL